MGMTKTLENGDEILDFDVIEEEFDKLSTRGRLTLMYRLLHKLPPTVLRIMIKYCGKRLDKLRAELPDDDPNKLKYQRKPSKGYEAWFKSKGINLPPKPITTVSDWVNAPGDPIVEPGSTYNAEDCELL